MSNLTLQLLGPFAATYDGRPLTRFRTKAVQALLIYLACQPEPHYREGLMALLWPEATQESAQNSLRQALYYLRQAVPELPSRAGGEAQPFVLANREVIQLNPEAVFDLDVAAFERLLTAPQTRWPEAVALYRGDLLSDVYLPDSAPFEEWVQARRADLRRQALEALDVLVRREMQQGAHQVAEEYARQQLAIDNLHERAHRRLVEILARRGLRSQALSHYETYCRLLEEELGVGPAEDSERLIEKVCSGELGLEVAPRSGPLHRPVRRHNLRPQATRLIGRERELADLAELMAAPEKRLINIVGPGGMGKSRLALAFAEQQLGDKDDSGEPRLADGVFFVALQPVRGRDEIIAAIAQAADFPLDNRDQRPPLQQLLDFLREKQLLLVLDNFEHLLDEAALLTELLADVPGLRLLVTSRERLGLYEEQAYPLLGLAVPGEADELSPETLVGYASAELFLERARRCRPDYEPSAEDVPHLAGLCRLVAGVPLALELAASWMDALSPGQMLAELRQNLDILSVELRDLPERHRSMRAVFDGAWARLAESEQLALAQLSVFRGDFDAPAAQAVAAADRRLLADLVRKSVVQYEADSGRYRLHELLRQYSEHRLKTWLGAEDGVSLALAARNRHSAHYCQALAAWERGLKSRRQIEVMAEIAADLDNVQAAWEQAVSSRDTNLLSKAADGLACFLLYRNEGRLGRRLFGLACQALEELSATSPREAPGVALVYGRLLAWHASAWANEDQSRSQDLARQSLNVLEAVQASGVDTRLERASAWWVMATALGHTTHHAEAMLAAKNSLRLSREVKDDWHIASALDALGWVAVLLGQKEQARKSLEAGLALQRKLGNSAGELSLIANLAELAASEGDFVRAERHERVVLSLAELLGNKTGVVTCKLMLAGSLSRLGRSGESALLNQEAVVGARRLGLHWHVVYGQASLAGMKEAQGAYDEAASLAWETLALTREQSDGIVIRLCLRILSTVAIVQGRYPEADRLIAEREKQLGAAVAGREIGLACRAYAAIGRQDDAQAARYLQAALTGDDQRAQSLLWTLPAGALLLARLGDIDRALTIYAAVSGRPSVGHSRWFDDVVGAPLRKMARSLPPRAVQAAEARGRQLDLWQAAERLREALEEQVGLAESGGPDEAGERIGSGQAEGPAQRRPK